MHGCTHVWNRLHPQFMVLTKTPTFDIFRGRNVRGRNVRAETSVAETSVVEMPYIHI